MLISQGFVHEWPNFSQPGSLSASYRWSGLKMIPMLDAARVSFLAESSCSRPTASDPERSSLANRSDRLRAR